MNIEKLKNSNRLHISLLVVLYVGLIASVTAFVLTKESWEMREYLQRVLPFSLEINFFLIVAGILLNVKLLRKMITSIPKRAWVLVIVIAISGFLITSFVAPRTHRIFYDEDIYIHIGQTMADLNRAAFCNDGGHSYGEYFCNEFEYNKEPYGWPFLISIPFRILGPSYLSCFLLNNIIWMCSILLVFLLGFLIFNNINAGIFGALIFSFIPEGLLWSNSASAEPSAMFFSGLAMFAACFFVKNPTHRTLFLCTVLFPFASQFRPESIMVTLPAFLWILYFSPKELLQKRTYGYLLLFLILATPHLIHLISVSHEGWGAMDSAKFALSFFKDNFSANGYFYINNIKFPLLFTLFGIAGLILPLPMTQPDKNKKEYIKSLFFGKEKSVLVLWFILFWGIFLFFYAGSYNYGMDVRFSLLSYIPIAILAGYGVAVVCSCLGKKNEEIIAPVMAALIILCFSNFLPYVRAIKAEAWGARVDHEFAETISKNLPENSIVLTHNPNMFLVWGNDAAQASFATVRPDKMEYFFDKYKGGVYFYFNFWCNVDDPLQVSFCNNILNTYITKEILARQVQDYKYALYELKPKITNNIKANIEKKELSGNSFFK